MTQSEVSMEWALIKQLTGDVSQWTYRKDIVDEEFLWANFRAKLNQNNQAALDGEPVTDAEFHQIREYMLDVAMSPYKAALWLAGENGEAVIPLTRERQFYRCFPNRYALRSNLSWTHYRMLMRVADSKVRAF